MQYVHGYSAREAERLSDQANALGVLLHDGVRYARGRRVIEIGCGTGAQTVFLAANSPEASFVSIDHSSASLDRARQHLAAAGHSNVEFQRADLYDLPFDEGSFDDAFVCFVLEHLREPGRALGAVRRVVRPGGTLTVIEGDHGSWYCHPQTKLASRAVRCLIDIQDELGGDSLIGRRLYPLLVDAGFVEVRVTPRQVYVDGSRPDLIEAFSRNTFIAMVEGVRDVALTRGYMTTGEWDQGIADLYRATAPDGTFCYTFFRGTATRSQERAKEPGA